MNTDITSFSLILLPLMFGAGIAGAHLIWLRLSLNHIHGRYNPSLSHIGMSFVRMLSVAVLLIVVARYLEPIAFFVLITSFIVSRMLLMRKLLPDATHR